MDAVSKLIGRKFGRLTVISRAENSKAEQSRWLCRCEYSNEKIVFASALKRGATKSCGCLNNERRGRSSITHGLRSTKLYAVWNAMKVRCHTSSDKAYKHYGARGIKVCDEWRNDFLTFYKWAMANGYKEGLTIDRKNNDGNYSPSNCRWADRFVQGRNKRNNRHITYGGKTQILSAWARELGIGVGALHCRLATRSVDKVFSEIRTKS